MNLIEWIAGASLGWAVFLMLIGRPKTAALVALPGLAYIGFVIYFVALIGFAAQDVFNP